MMGSTWSQRRQNQLILRAPAKVNLFLEILGKRPDGFHELTTLMVTVSLFDTLEIKEDPSQQLSLSLAPTLSSSTTPPGTGMDRDNLRQLSTDSDNLILKAADLIRQRTGCERGAMLRLHKRIPMEAGLAGGSTDAAATLLGLNRLWSLGLTKSELEKLAAELGSDVAFFFSSPAAWCTGRGEIVSPVSVGRPFWLVLVCPPVGISTAETYRRLNVPENPRSGDRIRQALKEGTVEELGKELHNRLMEPAREICFSLAEIVEKLEKNAPNRWLMSGSGSTFFALCRDQSEAGRLANSLASLYWESGSPRLFVTRIYDRSTTDL